MPHIKQITITPTSMDWEEVGPDIRFRWYTPGDEASEKFGVFLSEPYWNDRDELLVDILLDGEDMIRRVELSSMGITPNTSGEDAGCMTVFEEE